MANSLYPTFTLPTIANINTDAADKKYKQSISFDYEIGDFKRDPANRMVLCSGHEAYIQWCLKVCGTERYSKLAYSDKVGVEIVSAAQNADNDIDAVKMSIERTVTEALMVHPATEYVKDFVFEHDGDSLKVTCTVKGKEWNEDTISVSY
jgi:hypothetical protein